MIINILSLYLGVSVQSTHWDNTIWIVY